MVTMNQLMTALLGLTLPNLMILGTLVVTWGRSYWRFQARHTRGLLAFGVLLLVQNGFAAYLYTLSIPFTNWMRLAEPQAMLGMVGLAALQLVPLTFLARITWK